MGRRKQTDEGERRSVSLSLWLTPSERAELDERAAEAGIRLSDFARAALLGYRVTANGETLRRALFELSAIGNNLNQLARRAHITDEVETEALDEALGTLKTLSRRWLDGA